MKREFETWQQIKTWEWCQECLISWHEGDKPTCTCESEKMQREFETWQQIITWEWCQECSISWHEDDKPTCTCEADDIVVLGD